MYKGDWPCTPQLERIFKDIRKESWSCSMKEEWRVQTCWWHKCTILPTTVCGRTSCCHRITLSKVQNFSEICKVHTEMKAHLGNSCKRLKTLRKVQMHKLKYEFYQFFFSKEGKQAKRPLGSWDQNELKRWIYARHQHFHACSQRGRSLKNYEESLACCNSWTGELSPLRGVVF